MLLKVHVVPNAGKAKVARVDYGTLEVRVDERPERGRANKRLLEILADYFGVPKSKVTLVAGARSRDKIVLVAS
ncbi:MAG: DUF167 domain-containing protein [Nitrososphaerota archaeon]|nr:DUF167 domain-containing protein [Nitrososphaerota archaeon]